MLGIFQAFQLSKLINENQQKQNQTTVFLENNIKNYIQEHQRVVHVLAKSLEPLLIENDLQSIQKKLEDIKDTFPGFVNLYVGNEKGQSVVFYPEVYTDGAQRGNLDFSDRDYYKELVKTKKPVLSSVFHGRGGTNIMLVTTLAPILSASGEMEGYVLGALDLNVLAEEVKASINDKESHAVVLDQENNVVVHPNVDTKTELVNLSEDQLVKYINGESDAASGEFVGDGTSGEEEFITYTKIKDLDWKVWIGTPTRIINHTFRKAILTVVGFVVITTLIMLGVSYILTNRLERTIRNLLDYIKEYKNYTKGVIHKRSIKRKSNGPREMEELFDYFDNLIEEVETNREGLVLLNRELEERVQDRTATLENKNMELKAVNKLITSVSSDKDLTHFIQDCLIKIKPFMDNKVHVIFQDIAVTSDEIIKNKNIQHYLNHHMTGQLQHMEPIQIGKDLKGFLVVDLQHEQEIVASDQEFLQTFATSLAIMLQNKFLFEKIRNKHAELEAILESMSEGLMLLNNHNEVEYVNEFFQSVVMEDAKGELLTLEDVSNQFTRIFEINEESLEEFFQKEKNAIKLERVTPAGKTFYYAVHNFSVILDDATIGQGLLLRDITKEEEIDTLKNNLISLTSHEFKTPITNIKGSVETLLRADVQWEPDFQQELLEGVHEDIERIQHLVSDWMDISKIESGTMYIVPNMIRADHIIEESIDQIPQMLKQHVTFEFVEKADEQLYFFADKIRVQQVLVNLFMNGIRYNDEVEKKINITLEQKEEWICISVSDNGIGISMDHIQKIFNRFYQVDITATRRTGGTGLGLAICKGIMEAHGGTINVSSVPGEGSTFTLYFPIREEDESV